MNRTIVYRGREYSIYGWEQKTVFPFYSNAQSKKPEPVFLSPGSAAFSCAITFTAGACFTLKETGEIFEIISSKINLHKARRIGREKAATATAVFLASPR